jgi:hypothetical protein
MDFPMATNGNIVQDSAFRFSVSDSCEPLLLQMLLIPLRLQRGRLLLDLLKGPHRVTVKSSCELHEFIGLNT